MKIISVPTKRGLILRSVMYEANNADTVVILMTGICSNIFNNQLLQSTGEVLSSSGIAYICGQTMNAFSLLHYSNIKTHCQELKGVAIDNLDVTYEDIDAYVDFAKQEGFKNIILAGHSLGSNKIIYYLSINHDPSIKNYIISGPVDFVDFTRVSNKQDYYIKTAEKFVEEGRGDEILPFLFNDFSSMSANTLLKLYDCKFLRNCPFITGIGETNSLNKIEISGAIIIGEKDSCARPSALEFAKKINSCTKHPEDNKIIIIKDASHVFYNKHNEYASCVLDFVKSRQGVLV